MSLVAEIKHDEGLVKHDDVDKELIVLRDKRIDINSKLKLRGASPEHEKSLREEKVVLLKLMDEKNTNMKLKKL